VNRLRNLNLEVSLLSLVSEAKAPPQQVKQEASLHAQTKILRPPTQELAQQINEQGRDVRPEERVVQPQEKKEETLFQKEQGSGSLPVQKEENVILPGSPFRTLYEDEKWEIGSMKKEGAITASYVNPPETKGASGKTKLAIHPPSLSDGEILLVQPKYAENPKPLYPSEARRRGYEGEVVLKVEVLPNGRVGQIEVKCSSGYELLDQSALTTVRQWKFVPARKGENPIPLWVNIPVKFQLQ
jgi:TonB family protein